MRRGVKTVGVYKITSPSGRVYIGQNWNIEHRWAEYRSPGYRAQQPKLVASFRKYGVQSHDFQVIFLLGPAIDQPTLDQCEIFFMDFFRERGVRLLNLREGGSAGRHSEETKRKIGEKSKGHPPTSTSFKKGSVRLRTEEWKRNISVALTGKTISKATREKLRVLNSGSNHPKYGTRHSEETRRLIGLASKERVFSAEHRQKLSEAKRGNTHRLGKRHTEATKQRISLAKQGINA